MSIKRSIDSKEFRTIDFGDNGISSYQAAGYRNGKRVLAKEDSSVTAEQLLGEGTLTQTNSGERILIGDSTKSQAF